MVLFNAFFTATLESKAYYGCLFNVIFAMTYVLVINFDNKSFAFAFMLTKETLMFLSLGVSYDGVAGIMVREFPVEKAAALHSAYSIFFCLIYSVILWFSHNLFSFMLENQWIHETFGVFKVPLAFLPCISLFTLGFFFYVRHSTQSKNWSNLKIPHK